MAPFAREKGISRRNWLLAGLAIPLFRARADNNLIVTYDGDNLYPVAPSLHFLTGRVLDRLRDSGDIQAFISRLSLFHQDSDLPLRSAAARFVVSYSIWEERFKVTIPGPTARSVEGLTAPEAEAWCMSNLAISASGLAPAKPFRMRLELRPVPQRDLSRVLGDSGLSISSMIEILGRKAGVDEKLQILQTGWMRLIDLPRLKGRPPRNG
jgi:hypothetical protein